jgi:hypothetical protein
MQLSPFPCHLVPLRSKYFPQHPILKHPQPVLCTLYISSIFKGHFTSTDVRCCRRTVPETLQFRTTPAAPSRLVLAADFGHSFLSAEQNTHIMSWFGKGTDCTTDRNTGSCHCFFDAKLLSCFNFNPRVQNISIGYQCLSLRNTF